MSCMQSVVYKLPNRFGFVVLPTNLLDTLYKYRQNINNQPEAGGILLGYRRGQHIEIVSASEPHGEDKQTRIRFVRQDPFHQKFAYDEWKKSKAYIDYIGEWHTHPEPDPTPSSIDLKHWGKIKNNNTKDEMIGIIIGLDGDWIGLMSYKPAMPLLEIKV